MAESGSNERGKERGREGERVTDGYRERKRDNIGITEIQREKDERQTRCKERKGDTGRQREIQREKREDRHYRDTGAERERGREIKK